MAGVRRLIRAGTGGLLGSGIGSCVVVETVLRNFAIAVEAVRNSAT
jgi:hypothetical protein